MPRHCETCGEGGGRLWLPPYVRLPQVAEGAHRRLEILLTIKEIGAERWERLDDLANATGRNQARQIARRLMPLRIGERDGGARVGEGEKAALRCNSIGVKVNGVPHDRAPIRSRSPEWAWCVECLVRRTAGVTVARSECGGSSMIALPSVGLRATTLCEPRQIRKEAALSGSRRAQRMARPAALSDCRD